MTDRRLGKALMQTAISAVESAEDDEKNIGILSIQSKAAVAAMEHETGGRIGPPY